ncbi:uncharacterized protein BXZ73DRAFT_55129, partial [Epithele typhae]|uniref:uncharacterized protein n=1 Tax=Epithele typhae TaxID=378194 RepID=UPI00200840EB
SPLGVATLPSSILEHVFLDLYNDYSNSYQDFGHGFHASWVPVSWVCRHWRATALTTSELWHRIDFQDQRDPASIAPFLERAGARDNLCVSFSGSDLDISAACAAVLPFAPRTSYFAAIFEPAHAPAVLAVLAALGPPLKSLQVFATGPVLGRELRVDAARTPRLETLEVEHVVLRVDGTLHALSELSLAQLWGVGAPALDSAWLLGLLRACPNLRELYVDSALPGVHLDASDPRMARVELKELEEIRIDDFALDIQHVLRHLAVPETCTFDIVVRYDEDTEGIECGSKDDDSLRTKVTPPMDAFPENRWELFPALATAEHVEVRLGARGRLPEAQIAVGYWTINIPKPMWAVPKSQADEEDDDKKSTVDRPALAIHVLLGLPALANPRTLTFLSLHLSRAIPALPKTTWLGVFREFGRVRALTLGGFRAFGDVMEVFVGNPGARLLPALLQLTACVAVDSREGANVRYLLGANMFAAWLEQRKELRLAPVGLVVEVPDRRLNGATVKFASALVAYMAVRGWSQRVHKEECPTCHGVCVDE